MKKNYLSIVITGAALCALAGCQDELDQNKVKDGDYVPFAIAGDKTRTAYDGSDSFQINWVDGDKVRVFCYQAENVNNAEYSVERNSTTQSTGKLVPNASGLKWGGSDNEHKFYAVYPSDNSKCSVDENGIATFQMNLNQTATIGTKTGSVYSTTPDMSNAFMVAYATGTASQTSETNPVKLAFKPIMTTLEITVRGKADNSSSVQLTGISLSMEVPTEVASTGKFQYDIANKQLITDVVDTNTATTTETIFVNLVTDGDDNTNALTLGGGESVKITAFLPPVPVNLQNQVKVRVHATGAENLTVTLGKEKTDGTANINIEASQKATNITLPKIPTDQKGNNWITPLDDKIYVSQMSIPGTHDSGTGDGTTFSIGQTQDLTLDKQFELGIRAFDLRPAVSDGDLKIYHGYISTTYRWDQIMERFKYYLQTNPGEFIIILMRHETEADSNSDSWGGLIEDKLNTLKNGTNPSTGESWTIDFKPDLTIGDMRGKILFLCRDWTKYNENGPTVGGYTGWSHNKNGAEVSIYGPSGESSGTLNIQDCYAPSESGDWEGLLTGSIANNRTNKPLVQNYPTVKWDGIESLLKKSQQFHTSTELVNRWSINHTSGYVGGVFLGVYNSVSTTDGYRENAANNNIKLYNYINSSTWKGSTGIVMMDFVGARTSGSYTVYGDLCPQAIIDNNYKYRMLRKGE